MSYFLPCLSSLITEFSLTPSANLNENIYLFDLLQSGRMKEEDGYRE